MRSLLAVIFLFGLPLAAAENLLRNPGFEDAVEGAPAHWSRGHRWFEKPRGSGLSEVDLDEEVFQGPGQRSLRIVGRNNRGIAQQQVQLKPEWGTRFRLAGWIRLRDTGSACGRIDAECIGADNQWLKGATALVTDWRKSTQDWQRFEKEFTVTAETAALRVNCTTDRANTGTVWFDNLELEALEPHTQTATADTTAQPAAAAAEPAPQNDPVQALIPIDDFEGDDATWYGKAWGKGIRPELELRTDGARQGHQYLRITCPSAEASMIDRTWNYDGPWDAISFWTRRASGSGGATLYAFCGQVAFHVKWFRPADEWQKVSARIDEVRYGWGAKDEPEKIFDPAKVTRLSFGHDRVIGFDVDDVSLDLDRGVVLRTACTERRANLFDSGEHTDIVADMLNAGESPVPVVLEAVLIPWHGDAIPVVRRDVTLAPRSYRTERIPTPVLPNGYSSVRVRLIHNGRIAGERSVGLCVLPSPQRAGRPFMGASGFGMTANRADLGRRVGVQAAEVMLNWRTAEPEPGVYRLDGIGTTLDAFEEHGFTTTCMILISTSRIPRWLLPDAGGGGEAELPRDTDAFARFLHEVVQRYGPRFDHFSFCCEIDLLSHRLKRGTDGYVDLVRTGSEAIRRSLPRAIIGGIGVSGGYAGKTPRFPVARSLWEQLHTVLDGFYFDAYASPRYYGPGLPVVEPEANDLVGILTDAVKLVRQYGPDKRVAIEEKGWAIDSRLPVDAPEARAMAACLARSYLLARSVDEIEHYMWFQLDSGGNEGGYSYSLFRHEGDVLNPRPGVAAYAWVGRFLSNAAEPRRIPLHKDLFALVFAHEKGSRAALWTPLENPVRFDAALPESVRLTDMLGNPLPPAAEHDGGLALSTEPVYVWAERVSAADLAGVLARGTFHLPCAALALTMPDARTCRVHVRNLLNGPLEGALLLQAPAPLTTEQAERPVSLPPDGLAVLAYPLRPAESAKTSTDLPFRIALTTENRGKITLETATPRHAVHRLAAPPQIDGDLAEFSHLPPIRLDGQAFLDPPDAPSAGLWTGVDDLSAEIRVAWDDSRFYLAARVHDDTFVQEQTGSRIWANDSIQIAFDPLNDAAGADVEGRSGYGIDDREFGVALTPEGSQTYQWTGAPDGKGRLVRAAELAVRRDGSFTLYEWALPWSLVFEGDQRPRSGRIIGFNAVFLDADQKGKTARYWMGITPGICGGKDPAQYRDFVLADGPPATGQAMDR